MSAAYYGKKKKDPQEDMMALKRVIAEESFCSVHLVYGNEDYLRLQFRDDLVKAMGGVKGSLAFDRFIGPDTDPKRIVGLAETLPFMAPRRVILIEDTEWFKKGCEEIEEYIEQGVCESTCIVFCEKEVDKRLRLFKSVTKNGMASEFPTQSTETIISWMRNRMHSAGTPISSNDAAYMVNLVGTDMMMLANEADKLSAYCLDKGGVSRTDIDAICTRGLEDRVFDMCDALALNEKKRAMHMYSDLLSLKEKPFKIIVLITRHFDTLLKLKDLEMGRRRTLKQMAELLGRPEFAVEKLQKQTARYEMDELMDIVEMCADTDFSIKTGMMEDKIALDTLVIKLGEMETGL